MKYRPVVVIGLANPEREAWVLAGFEPSNDTEKQRLKEIRDQLGFYPHESSHKLRPSGDDTATYSAKRVLMELTNRSAERERQCWKDSSLVLLKQRGQENGLCAFLEEVSTRLAPVVGHARRPPVA